MQEQRVQAQGTSNLCERANPVHPRRRKLMRANMQGIAIADHKEEGMGTEPWVSPHVMYISYRESSAHTHTHTHLPTLVQRDTCTSCPALACPAALCLGLGLSGTGGTGAEVIPAPASNTKFPSTPCAKAIPCAPCGKVKCVCTTLSRKGGITRKRL